MRKPPCRVCNSRRYRKTDTGVFVCQNGHQLESYVEELEEFTEAGGRRVVRQRKRQRAAGTLEPAEKPLFGENPGMLLAEVFQLLLKAQVQVLIDRFGFDPQFENVVQQLWLIYASDLPLTVSVNVAPVQERNTAESDTTAAASLESTPQSSSIEDATATDSERQTPPSEPPSTTRRIKRRGVDLAPISIAKPMLHLANRLGFPNGVVLCYLAAIQMRYPVTLNDFHGWIRKGDLPFLSFRDHLPAAVRARLTGYYKQSDKTIPSMPRLSNALVTTMRVFKALGVSFPDLNVAAMTSRFQEWLGFPDSIYAMVVQAARETDWSFGGHGEPYLKLMSVCVIVIKMVYGLHDGMEYKPPECELEFPPLNPWLTEAELKWKALYENDLVVPFHIVDLESAPVSGPQHLDCLRYCLRYMFNRRARTQQEQGDFKDLFTDIPSFYDALPDTDPAQRDAHPVPSIPSNEFAYNHYLQYAKTGKNVQVVRYHSDYARLLNLACSYLGVDDLSLQKWVVKSEKWVLYKEPRTYRRRGQRVMSEREGEGEEEEEQEEQEEQEGGEPDKLE